MVSIRYQQDGFVITKANAYANAFTLDPHFGPLNVTFDLFANHVRK